MKPNPSDEITSDYDAPSSSIDLSSYGNADRIWGLCQAIDKNRLRRLPIWSAFNSLLSDTPTVIFSKGLHLCPGSPTDWGNLYTASKIVQGINLSVSGNNRKIVTLDLQLYSKCMQMREKNEIKGNFILWLGELHIVFSFLKVIGKYILSSDVDQMLNEVGMYGSTNIGQIFEGKCVKQVMKANTII